MENFKMPISDSLAGKVVIVTGAGRGIGRAIAICAAEAGAKVVVNDLGGAPSGIGSSSAPADEVVREIQEFGGEAVANYDSVATPEGGEAITGTAVKRFGKLDAVVNNAGILRDKIFHRMAPEDFESVVKVHLFGTFNVSSAAAKHFRANGHGCFVNFTSNSGLIGSIGQANYAAAKLGVVGLSKSIALDMQRFGVRSNCIAPFAWSRLIGTLPTETEEEKARVARFQAVSPDTIAPLAVYLMSDAASNVTGQIFAVRMNEIFLMSQPRPIRSIHNSNGWDLSSLKDHGMPALEPSFVSMDRTADVFPWDPV